MKVKRLLDSLAYLLLRGNMDGVVTDYKEAMHAKREIPASSCPRSVENMLYATGASTDSTAKEEAAAFDILLDSLDDRAKRFVRKAERKPKKESLFHKKNRLGINGGQWVTVDTDGKFRVGDNFYMIDENEIQYQPIETEYGDLYDMDRILVSGGKFYDMNFDEVRVYQIGGIF